ncbi:3'-5' exoribonuclease domain-containing protein [Lysobacter sp. TAB13]|uniref:3'-5' exoribonuclease domain-containing protein n=1 Tax=Lysobacter sp. TAB13 TaxID=3233065 RepID=UPI003F99995C
MAKEIYVSTDIESDGPIPAANSMLSLGSAAFTADGELIATFSANLLELEGAAGDPKTLAWWAEQPQAWDAARVDARSPSDVMTQYLAWLKDLPGKPVFVAYPAGFDFSFVYWYLIRFTGESPFSHSALDMKTLAMAVLDLPYRDTSKRAMPRHWFSDDPHTHIALDDAIEQGRLFCKMLAQLKADSAALKQFRAEAARSADPT